MGNTEHAARSRFDLSSQQSAQVRALKREKSPADPSWLVERDACGVGFIADRQAQASHRLVQDALTALSCMEHRGGCCADRDSGDGAGVMTAIPWPLLQSWASESGLGSLAVGQVGVGMVFLPSQERAAALVRQALAEVVDQAGLKLLGWRPVPVAPETLGPQAKAFRPQIEQVLVEAGELDAEALERRLFLLRRGWELAVRTLAIAGADAEPLPEDVGTALRDFYVCSFSGQTIVYKGMVRSQVLGQFYRDLQNPDYASHFAVYHRRFSTNTMPKWPLAHPMRLLGHNGEINTLIGNINWMAARESELSHEVWGDDLAQLKPIVNAEASDSANLDGVMELLVRSGRTPTQALMMMVPEAYDNQPDLISHPEITSYYEYYAGIQEPWDGPALVVFSDGHQVGATLDRNGLRPARYAVTRSGYLVVSSEAGVVDLPADEIIEKGRLGPGQMIAVDFETQEILKNWELKQRVAQAQPYGEWLQAHRHNLSPQLFSAETRLDSAALLTQQTAFGYTAEDLDMVIQDMAAQGKEPTYCMGDDTPLAVLSEKPHLLYNYFKQRFAQVTNPPIDPLRERLVMSLNMYLGKRGNLLDEQPDYARRLKLESPVLNEQELTLIDASDLKVERLSTLYDVAAGPAGLGQAVAALCERAVTAVLAGAEVLVLSDRPDNATQLSADQTYVPPLLAVGAVHHHLIEAGLRMRASIVADTAQCWSTHHFACLIGYGASAACPYLALESVRHWWADKKTQKLMETGKLPQVTLNGAQDNYRKAVDAGLLKILSKMGISLLSSYQGAQIFEAVGIGDDLLHLGFRGSVSRLGGLSVADLAQETMRFHSKAFPELTRKKLENMGFVQARPSGEYHANNPQMSKLLHEAVREKRYDHYQLYQEQLKGRPITALRDLLDLESDRASIPLDQVEPVEEIMQRFCTGGMSLGALSPEAHETLAIAMNRIGGKSNSGEGGEDPVRFNVLNDVDDNGLSATLPHLKGLKNGDTANSAIKQVASGRFGVTPEYLMSAKQIEIKMAQGAKPGEGGQLPGRKVSEYIATLRRSKPGVTLISPPPHHDIYSIEDLAQLIFDLHQINPQAGVSVKLVAEVGIGTIAAGVAKGNADVIQISGHDGGTGASPLSSIKHAGLPWELGLTEVHRVLMENQLRDRVLLRVDGGLKTGWDVVMGALMGAEQYGFGSVAMIAEGCIMARVCHMNSCPVGVTTQREDLRRRFPGTPEHVVNFFYFVAEEVRSLLAKLGYSALGDLIGRADLLRAKAVNLTKTKTLDLRCLTELPDTRRDRSWLDHGPVHDNGPVLDDEILADAEVAGAIARQTAVSKTFKVVNTDRSVGGRIAGVIAQKYGNSGFEGHLNLTFEGSAGQSFGAFTLPGMTLTVVGEANDYVGKGMHGGEIIVRPSAASQYDPAENVVVGNTCLYGATGGTLYAQGKAGERFAVRNSKGQAVIEGAGDHCCEYMTGGVVVVLGGVGRNVGAGMTGGLGYFLDEAGDFPTRVNPEIVKVQRVISPAGERQLKAMIAAHAERTGSPKAAQILEAWNESLQQFWQVVPPSEAEIPEASTTVEKVASSVS